MLAEELQQEYQRRFVKIAQYRRRVWRVLVKSYFQAKVGKNQDILDLGCGWGEFINQVEAKRKYAMDLNPDAGTHLSPDIEFLHQDCSQAWEIPDESLDVVFTSNFLEHLFSKESLSQTLSEAYRCLKPGGKIICLGPNLRYTGGSYWDFFDHHLPLTDASMSEILELKGFQVDTCIPRFLPYTMANGRQLPLWTVSLYLSLPFAWKILGKQFLVTASKTKL